MVSARPLAFSLLLGHHLSSMERTSLLSQSIKCQVINAKIHCLRTRFRPTVTTVRSVHRCVVWHKRCPSAAACSAGCCCQGLLCCSLRFRAVFAYRVIKLGSVSFCAKPSKTMQLGCNAYLGAGVRGSSKKLSRSACAKNKLTRKLPQVCPSYPLTVSTLREQLAVAIERGQKESML